MSLGHERQIKQQPVTEEEEVRIGVDEWVAQVDRRRQQRSGPWGQVMRRWEAIPASWRVALVALLLLTAPLVVQSPPVLDALNLTDADFIVRTGATFLIFSLLAVGLTVVVGYAGLLDLGYVAFYGIGGYAYAYLASDFVATLGITENGIHLPSLIALPIIIVITAFVGWLLGFASIRLSGDYLAIVTLGFGLLFVQLAMTLTRVDVFWLDRSLDLTRGPNGINRLDDLSFFGFQLESTLAYYYFFLLLVGLIVLIVYRLNHSRIGRAWRALREDELATEVMGMPVRRLKLTAFAMGAGIAALAGASQAAWQGNVVPTRYNALALIDLYAMIVLGGTGSLPGALLGAFIFTVLPEVLRSVQIASIFFYGGLVLGLLLWLGLSRRFLVVLGGLVAGGLVFKVIADVLWPGLDAGVAPTEGMVLNRLVQEWLVLPANFELVGNIAIGLAVLLLLLVTVTTRRWRWPMLGVALYLLIFAWETRLVVEPAVTRILIIGTTLVVLMIVRPEGLLGKPRVTVV